MSIREQIDQMPGEKQVAWGVRLFMSVAILAFGTITWSALGKLDRIAEIQVGQTVKLDRLVTDDATRRARMDTLTEMYYRLADQLRALDLRIGNIEQRSDVRRDDPER